jgi:uncharacterized protein (TIGR03437 family)
MRRRAVWTLVSWLGCGAAASGQNAITTVAGGTTFTFPTSVTAALNAPLGNLSGVAVDSQDNIYVADTSNQQIFVASPDGAIRLFAGNGTRGLLGDGGLATSASLNSPGGVAVDASGNLFIADAANVRVRKVSAGGIITTVAGNGGPGFAGDGGLATSASLNSPSGLAVDASGNLYIADYGNNRIRKVSATGVITTFAGNGNKGFAGDGAAATSAALNGPRGVAVDVSGNLYIADSGNNRIREVSPSGIITTVAGNGFYTFSGDSGPATSASLAAPYSVAVDASGNLFITDSGNIRVRKMSASGIITTVAGNGTAGFSGDGGPAPAASLGAPEGVAVDAGGNLFIAEFYNDRIRKVSAGGIITTFAGNGNFGFSGDGGPATAASLNGPSGVFADALGNLYIADTSSDRIRKVTPDGIITTIAGSTSPGGFAGDGGPATSARLNLPVGLAVDASGNIFIADDLNGLVRKVSPGGIITTVAGNGIGGFSGDGGPATSASLENVFGVSVDASGNLFIADYYNNRIRKVSTSGVISTVAGSGTFGFGTGGFAGDGGPATSAMLKNPGGVVVDAAGNLFIADYGNNRIRKVSAGGIITTVAGNGTAGFSGDGGPATAARLNGPQSIAVDGSGNLFFAEYFNNRVRKVSAGGIITTVAGSGNYGSYGDGGPAIAAALYIPQGVAVDSSGNLFIADSDNNRIREVAVSPLSLSVSSGTLYFSSRSGYATTQSQPLQIGGTVGAAWQATASTFTGGSWLSVSPGTGQIPGSLTVALDPSNLATGSYQGIITIQSAGATPPSITISVMLQVYYVPPYAYQVVSSASSYVSGQNGFGIAQGSLFAVQGYAIGPATLQQTSSFPIPLTLAGTSIQINMSGGTYNAPMVSASDSQDVAILPSAVPAGDGTLVVAYNGYAADPIPIHVVKSGFGIFTVTGNGAGVGIVQDVNQRQLTFAQPASAGDTVTLSGTGLGPVNGDEAAGPLPGNLFKPEVFVGNRAATVQYAGRSDCCAGKDQVSFQIPSDVQGCFVPLVVRTTGLVSNFVSLPIGPAGEACSDPVGFSSDLVTKAANGGLNAGGIALGPVPVLQSAGFSFLRGLSERLSAMLGTQVTEQELLKIVRASGARHGQRALKAAMKKYAPILKAKNIDPAAIEKMARALNYQGVSAGFQMGMSASGFASQVAGAFPPPGTCTAGPESPFQTPGTGAAHHLEDAGPQLFLSGPAGAQTVNQLSNGEYQLSLGSGLTSGSFPSGTYFLSSNGGKDVGPFSASIQIGSSLTWTNKASVGFIDRSEPLTITWSGGPAAGYVVFAGAGSAYGQKVAFACVADVRNQTLTVPDYVLSAIPHTSNGSVFLAAHPLQNLFSAPGIDVGFFADLTNDSKSIGFQ